MGVIQVVGTCLPIFQEWESVTVRTGTLTFFSVVFGLLGFTLSVLAAHSKGAGKGEDHLHPVGAGALADRETEHLPATELKQVVAGLHQQGAPSGRRSRRSSPSSPSRSLGEMRTSEDYAGNSPSPTSGKAYVEAPAPVWKGLAVAIFSGLTSSMLQFAFVFGNGMVADAEELGVAKIAAPMVVWLLAFEIATIPNVAISAMKITRDRAWGGFLAGPSSQSLKSGGLCLAMGFFFMGHIHLYGAGASLIGSLGAAIAWCLARPGLPLPCS